LAPTADPGSPSTPPTGTDDDSEAVRLLNSHNKNWEILFKTTPDDILLDFLLAAGNPTVKKRTVMLHALKTLRFDNHMVGQLAIDLWKPMGTSDQIKKQPLFFRAIDIEGPFNCPYTFGSFLHDK
jgi:hypothetical protein